MQVVKLRTIAAGPKFVADAGKTVELDDIDAERLIASGQAEFVSRGPAIAPPRQEVPIQPAASAAEPADATPAPVGRRRRG